jgi:hypothetical protein
MTKFKKSKRQKQVSEDMILMLVDIMVPHKADFRR